MRLIDVDKLISSLNWLVESGMTGNKTKAVLKLAIQTADAQPTVDAVKHGYWGKYAACSVCGKRVVKKIIINSEMIWKDEYDYCPHCGAKMDEVENG